MSKRFGGASSAVGHALALLLSIGIACLTRLGAVQNAHIDFDADEAIVGLMAYQILHGVSWPVFYAGQGYLGALEAWTAALAFLALGVGPETLRLVPFSYTLAFLVAQYLLLKRFFDLRAVVLILLWTSLGTPFLNLWSVKARGGFAEVLLLGSWFLLLFHRAWRDGYNRGASLWSLAALGGFGYFINPLIGTVMLPALLMLSRQAMIDWTLQSGEKFTDTLLLRRHTGAVRGLFLLLATLGLVAAGLALGVAMLGEIRADYPFRVRLRNGTRLVGIVAAYFAVLYLGQSLSFSRDVMARQRERLRFWWNNSPSLRILLAIISGVIFIALLADMVARLTDGGGYGRPFSLAPVVAWPKNTHLVFWELLPAVLGYGGSTAVILSMVFAVGLGGVVFTHRVTSRDEVLLFGGVTLSTILLVITSSYTEDAGHSRYFVPLLISLPATAYVVGKLILHFVTPRVHPAVLWLVVTIGLAGSALRGPASVFSHERGVDVMDAVVGRLLDLKVETVIGDYWTVYPIAFFSRGQILVAPVDGVDRFPSMSQRVKTAEPDAYVFSETAPSLQSFRQQFHGTDLQQERLSPRGESGPVIYIFRTATSAP